MTDARSEILARVRNALTGTPPPAPVPREYHREYHRQHPLDDRPADLVSLAAERIGDYRATVHLADADQVADRITAILRARAVRRMVAPADLSEAWRAAEITWLLDRVEEPLSTADLDGSDGVLTGCATVIAETGTIVLDGGPAQGRRAITLLPDYHLCVVRAEQILGSVPEVVAALAQRSATRPLTFISGPSATSDIEFNRVEGVHGPRTLDVLVLSAPAS
jgi:L-lactate dehydrogenase complex protein LldG